jgi:hypothetical protein
MSQMWRRRETKILVESAETRSSGARGGEDGDANRVGSSTKKTVLRYEVRGIGNRVLVRGFFVFSVPVVALFPLRKSSFVLCEGSF